MARCSVGVGAPPNSPRLRRVLTVTPPTPPCAPIHRRRANACRAARRVEGTLGLGRKEFGCRAPCSRAHGDATDHASDLVDTLRGCQSLYARVRTSTALALVHDEVRVSKRGDLRQMRDAHD